MLFISLFAAQAGYAGWPFPNSVGTTWRYVLTREPGKNTVPITRKIVPPSEGEDQGAISVESTADGVVQSIESLKLEGEAVIATSRTKGETRATFDSPLTIVPPKLEPGAVCDAGAEIAGIPVSLPIAVIGQEEIRVPAGSFRAWRFHGEDRSNVTISADRWFVPGVGAVKEAITERSPSGELLVRNTLELTVHPSASAEPEASPVGQARRFQASVSTSSGGDSLQTISAEALQIVARWRVHDALPKTKIRAVWTAEDVGEVAPTEYKIDEATALTTSPEATGTFTLERPEDGWAEGKYRVDFYVGNVLAETVRLTIATNNSFTGD